MNSAVVGWCVFAAFGLIVKPSGLQMFDASDVGVAIAIHRRQQMVCNTSSAAAATK